MKASSHEPQAPGRLLTSADIAAGLKGRCGSLFWPDDGLWYFVEINDVDVAERRAAITYATGETESLDLDEIVRNAHLSLICNGLEI